MASDAGSVWDEHGTRHRQDFGSAMFVHERSPIIGQQTAFVHGPFVDHLEWAIADHAARIVDRAATRTVTVCSSAWFA